MESKLFKITFVLSSALGALMLLLVFSFGCAEMEPTNTTPSEPTAPGLYDLSGWAYKPYHSYNNKIEDADIDGTVGHPLYVESPKARPVPRDQGWTRSYRITSGELPPGLSFDSANHDVITGIPTERGHWIVDIQIYDLHVGSASYGDCTQQLRFHITGSGEVH